MLTQTERMIKFGAILACVVTGVVLLFAFVVKQTKVEAAATMLQSTLTNVTGRIVVYVDVHLGNP